MPDVENGIPVRCFVHPSMYRYVQTELCKLYDNRTKDEINVERLLNEPYERRHFQFSRLYQFSKLFLMLTSERCSLQLVVDFATKDHLLQRLDINALHSIYGNSSTNSEPQLKHTALCYQTVRHPTIRAERVDAVLVNDSHVRFETEESRLMYRIMQCLYRCLIDIVVVHRLLSLVTNFSGVTTDEHKATLSRFTLSEKENMLLLLDSLSRFGSIEREYIRTLYCTHANINNDSESNSLRQNSTVSELSLLYSIVAAVLAPSCNDTKSRVLNWAISALQSYGSKDDLRIHALFTELKHYEQQQRKSEDELFTGNSGISDQAVTTTRQRVDEYRGTVASKANQKVAYEHRGSTRSLDEATQRCFSEVEETLEQLVAKLNSGSIVGDRSLILRSLLTSVIVLQKAHLHHDFIRETMQAKLSHTGDTVGALPVRGSHNTVSRTVYANVTLGNRM